MRKENLLQYIAFIFIFLIISFLYSIFQGIKREPLKFPNSYTPIQKEEAYLELQNPSRPTVHYFWAVWCRVCKINEPFLNLSLKNLQGKNIHFVSWEEGGSPIEKVQSYIKSHEINYPVAIASSEFYLDAKVQGYPTTIFTDATGRVLFVDTGILSPIGFWIRIFFLGLEF